MQTMLVTIVAMEDDDAVAECQAEIDLDTFEIVDLTDQSFVEAPEGTYDGFAIEIEDKYYPVAVDYIAESNEFMLMDADGIEAITKYASLNPTEVEGTPDALDMYDEDIE